MKGITRTAALALAGTLLLGGCATKGALRKGLAEQASALQAERDARIAGDAQLQQNLAALHTDLLAMRSEFGAKIVALEDGLSVNLPVHFGFNQADVQDEDYAALDRFAQAVQRSYPGSRITVAGFADPAGSARYNAALSEKRAQAVRRYLLARGLTEEQVQAVGFGESGQVVPGAAGERPGAELNRRVVFLVEGPTGATTAAVASHTPQ